MHVIDNIHAFIWQSMTANNCNSYLIDGPTRVLIDPGHRAMFSHVESGLKELGLGIDDIDLIICTHAHPDHLEAVQLFKEKRALFTLHETEWQWIDTIGKQMSAAFGIDMDSIRPDFFLQQGDLSLDDLYSRYFIRRVIHRDRYPFTGRIKKPYLPATWYSKTVSEERIFPAETVQNSRQA